MRGITNNTMMHFGTGTDSSALPLHRGLPLPQIPLCEDPVGTASVVKWSEAEYSALRSREHE
ncbi:MAG: hypothetical protein H3C64_06430 [Candidatus Kuenenia stuttgartiensis]|nr:hypothetical protein [Candidatus Kuenenia stuttgartiensis]